MTTFHRLLWPSEAAIARILDATGRKFIPSNINIAALRADLSRCRWQVLPKQIDTAAFRESHKKGAAATTEHARALRSLLKSSGNRLFDWQLWVALDPGDHDSALGLLERIASEADRIAKRGVDVINSDGGPKDYLVQLLGPIYKRHFQRKAGRSHDSSGPFPRFVEAVSGEMGPSIRTSRHTVHKSLANQRRAVGKT
jgi:hypothetical protein